eukprot:TRINITY_DN4836_c0_g1_i1.p1 TRINITY_DN4836_c0_g1~~TRINITY_DN4836_c0_g1_i1.p1  ORF type:complete len:185 (+),score=61.36 TRINITY_DN4836_c0_g1_i1:102-656(+)
MAKKKPQKKKQDDQADAMTRMNYLYQASHLICLSPSLPSSIGRFYMNTMKRIATRSTLRLDKTIKRTMCKKCSSLLIPSISSSVRVVSKKHHQMKITCDLCGGMKRFPIRTGEEDYPHNVDDDDVVDDVDSYVGSHHRSGPAKSTNKSTNKSSSSSTSTSTSTSSTPSSKKSAKAKKDKGQTII